MSLRRHSKTTGRFQLTTDNYNAYAGWSGAVRNTFGGQIDYGTETKHFATEFKSVPRRFNPVKCVAVIRTPLIGKPKRRMMTTNHSERCNLSFRLTPREGARLQSFDDDFVFAGNRSQVVKQIGNAVPPLLGKTIAEALAGVIETTQDEILEEVMA